MSPEDTQIERAGGGTGDSGNGPSAGFEPVLERPDDEIGHYRLISVLGEGGFGVVWLAERQRPFLQRVALKIVKPGMDSRQVIARFEQERQALAVMNHPGIARVLDGGMTPAGRPYFVMEYVKGEPITEFCDSARMGLDDRLRLFIQVCEAVQHAHNRAIIHRDLKPSNVLVTRGEGDKPLVKVIDFGVAKALSQHLTDKPLFTETGQLVGTPEYMSPEQADPDATDIDTRSDVYSLGVILYELLVGALPFEATELRRHGQREVQRIIREIDPPPPSLRLTSVAANDAARRDRIGRSRGTEASVLAQQLRLELEWIPMRALKKSRDERYVSPLELANDIHRYLAGQKLRAGPESFGYVVGKWVVRNERRVAVVGMSCGAAMVAAAIAPIYLLSASTGPVPKLLGALLSASVIIMLTFGLIRTSAWLHPAPRGESPIRRLLPALLAAAVLLSSIAFGFMRHAISARPETEFDGLSFEVAMVGLAAAALVSAISLRYVSKARWREAVAITALVPIVCAPALAAGLFTGVVSVGIATEVLGLNLLGAKRDVGRVGQAGEAWSNPETDSMLGGVIPMTQEPDPAVVSDAACIERIRASGYPWRVKHWGTGVTFLLVPEGTFTMGSPDTEHGRESDERQRGRRIVRPFYLSEYELTNEQWLIICSEVGVEVPRSNAMGHFPAHSISWTDAVAFTSVLRIFRLPTEAEWEYACRAGTDTPYSFGEGPADLGAPLDGNLAAGNDQSPNPWGFRGMHGGVWEWCADLYTPQPDQPNGIPVFGGRGARVIRGGSHVSPARACRSAHRGFCDPREVTPGVPVGVRLVLEPTEYLKDLPD